jgi:hypothetical protein
MSEQEETPQAFPLCIPTGSFYHAYDGMTLRDYFAGQALAGFCANKDAAHNTSPFTLARGAYSIADAMLDERRAQ